MPGTSGYRETKMRRSPREAPPHEKPPRRYGALGCLGVPIGVDRRKILPLLRQIFEREDGRHRANRDAGSTVDALAGADVELSLLRESRFILARGDTIHGAHIAASCIYGSAARLSYDVSHVLLLSRSSTLP